MGNIPAFSTSSAAPDVPGPTALAKLSTPELVDELVASGHDANTLAELQRRLGRHAFAELTSAMRTGKVWRRWRAAGFDTKHNDALHRHPTAEDIAQEAIMEPLRDLVPLILLPGRWDPAKGTLEAYFSSWCLRRAINVYRRYERAQRGEVIVEPDSMNERAVYMPGDSGRDPADIVCERDVARRALAALSDDQRAALGSAAAGLSNTEISQQLGIPIDAVRARISRGRRNLRSNFGPGER